jgi:hypothetical protein
MNLKLTVASKNYDEAIRLAAESLKFADSIANPTTRCRFAPDSLLLLAHLQRQSGCYSAGAR